MSEFLKSRKRLDKFEKEIIADSSIDRQLFHLEIHMSGLLRKLDCDVKKIPYPAGAWTVQDAIELQDHQAHYAILIALQELLEINKHQKNCK